MASKPFISTLDRLLHKLRKQASPTTSQKKEIEKHKKIEHIRGHN